MSGHPKPGQPSCSATRREGTPTMQGNLKALSSCLHVAYPRRSHPVLALQVFRPCRTISAYNLSHVQGLPPAGAGRLMDLQLLSPGLQPGVEWRTWKGYQEWCPCWKTVRTVGIKSTGQVACAFTDGKVEDASAQPGWSC